jgi:DNA-binding NtrC family response regulator
MTRPSASILIVDDEDLVRGLLSELLESSYWCATAASAEQAVTSPESGSVNLMLTEITIPGASGVELRGRHERETSGSVRLELRDETQTILVPHRPQYSCDDGMSSAPQE